jgi:hypothetical protein
MELPLSLAEKLTSFLRRAGERMMFMRLRRGDDEAEGAM